MSHQAADGPGLKFPDHVPAEKRDAARKIHGQFATLALRRLQGLFETTSNPLHVWRAYRLARRADVDVPGWVLAYLDTCSTNLTTSPTTSPRAVVSALGLGAKGGPSAIKRADSESRKLGIVDKVLALKKVDPERGDLDIFEQVAEEFGLSASRVKNMYYDWTQRSRELFPETL